MTNPPPFSYVRQKTFKQDEEMTRIRLKPDTLDEQNRKFTQTRLPQPLFLNSVPKSGSHLLRNIMRMFVPVEDQFKDQFIQWGNLQTYKHAFRAEAKMLSWGAPALFRRLCHRSRARAQDHSGARPL